uniref:LAGLIDADG endonuclease n=1 Tax=Monilinia laxa TaxID=61186 RepID=A0A7L8EZE6_MONLA|nr:LAGLIDADG endonuclease [Monilinia laxa]QOE17454.1 LAGLIDADG endonuclease [Monilinia laxa]QYB19876.1 LAGLIDADG endonuclease [Monilinia laxa]QYB19961.1 LAGLIDADG endonuclease [Monilinia laxa]QYB20042.1 LAGLIDADG endonuclease [Monilinia laxa]QYB20138.1 LAGLIDADG endonuclease [Monilinia laxa]
MISWVYIRSIKKEKKKNGMYFYLYLFLFLFFFFLFLLGCFLVFVSKSLTHALGFRAQLVFQITQHSRDKILIESLISYLGCGRLVTSSDGKVQFRVEKFSDNSWRSKKFWYFLAVIWFAE